LVDAQCKVLKGLRIKCHEILWVYQPPIHLTHHRTQVITFWINSSNKKLELQGLISTGIVEGEGRKPNSCLERPYSTTYECS